MLKAGNSAIVDEYTYTQLVDRSTATKALQEHWATFITECDFKEIAEAGWGADLNLDHA